MVRYRRNFVPGGSYFFTLALHDRSSNLLTDRVDQLRQSFRDTIRARPFRIEAIVILPDHLHAIWTLPPDDWDYPARWQAIKSNFSRRLSKSGILVEKRPDGSALVWQRRYWEHTIRDSEDLNRHIDYIHINPVKHGFVERVADWPFSSFHRHVKQGLLPANWATEIISSVRGEAEYGE